METYDCEPTLNDTEVLEFCKKGFLMLEGVVSDEVNRRTLEFVDAHPGLEPKELLQEQWFVDGVILQREAAGAVRSLLGRNFSPPRRMANHRVECPMPAQEWHTDGGSVWGPELDYLQVFYYPQGCPRELGPTEVLPGSHFLYSNRDYMRQYGRIRGSYPAVAPAGSIFITVYAIWHRRSESWDKGIRNALKYNYWRTQSPRRDWKMEPDFDFARADYGLHAATFRQQMHDSYDSARMYFWLRGESDKFRLKGGQGWPNTRPADPNDLPDGIPEGVARS